MRDERSRMKKKMMRQNRSLMISSRQKKGTPVRSTAIDVPGCLFYPAVAVQAVSRSLEKRADDHRWESDFQLRHVIMLTRTSLLLSLASVRDSRLILEQRRVNSKMNQRTTPGTAHPARPSTELSSAHAPRSLPRLGVCDLSPDKSMNMPSIVCPLRSSRPSHR